MTKTTYYLVGETHGTVESPRAAKDLLTKLNITTLALEFDHTHQREMDAYARGKRTLEDLTFLRPLLPGEPFDGRASSAVCDLIATARSKKIQLALVDDTTDFLCRDERMSKQLRRLQGNVLFYCGSVHASKTPLQLPFIFTIGNNILRAFGKGMIVPYDGMIRTCGSFLPPSQTIAYHIVARDGGTFYNITKKQMPPNRDLSRALGNTPLPSIMPSKDPAYDFIYVVETFTHSEPFRKALTTH